MFHCCWWKLFCLKLLTNIRLNGHFFRSQCLCFVSCRFAIVMLHLFYMWILIITAAMTINPKHTYTHACTLTRSYVRGHIGISAAPIIFCMFCQVHKFICMMDRLIDHLSNKSPSKSFNTTCTSWSTFDWNLITQIDWVNSTPCTTFQHPFCIMHARYSIIHHQFGFSSPVLIIIFWPISSIITNFGLLNTQSTENMKKPIHKNLDCILSWPNHRSYSAVEKRTFFTNCVNIRLTFAFFHCFFFFKLIKARKPLVHAMTRRPKFYIRWQTEHTYCEKREKTSGTECVKQTFPNVVKKYSKRRRNWKICHLLSIV